jgi:hypothetical protein
MINDDQGKAHAFLKTFFPPAAQYPGRAAKRQAATERPSDGNDHGTRDRGGSDADGIVESAWTRRTAVSRVSADMAYRKTLGFFEIFQASLRLSYFPGAWKVAKIVVLPKTRSDVSSNLLIKLELNSLIFMNVKLRN